MAEQVTLTGADRCDRCGAQALVAVKVAGVPLLFCGHHFGRHEVVLAAAGGSVLVDEREWVKPSGMEAVPAPVGS